MTVIALVGASIERWATEFRHLQRTEVLEAEEFFSKGQKGSSAMPHKRNPITGERLTGLARVLRGNALAALENVSLWHERDISHSSVERVIFPDSCTLLDYMLNKLSDLTDGLIVYPANMERNMQLSLGMWHSQTTSSWRSYRKVSLERLPTPLFSAMPWRHGRASMRVTQVLTSRSSCSRIRKWPSTSKRGNLKSYVPPIFTTARSNHDSKSWESFNHRLDVASHELGR